MEPLVVGQVVEFLVWAELAAQSGGQLHPFLPLWDRGIDAVIHRRTDGAYIPVQVKGRTTVVEGCVRFGVPAKSLADDEAWIVGAFLDGEKLGPRLLVIKEGDFKRLGSHEKLEGLPAYDAAVNLRPDSRDRWHPYVVAREELAARFGVEAQALEVVAPEAARRAPSDRPLGILGEAEVIRLLAAEPELGLYRPFPDLETVELVARHVTSFGVVGLQVKTVSVHTGHMETTVDIQRPSFRAAPSTFVVVLAWWVDQGLFHEECLVIPSTEIERIARLEGSTLQIAFTPGGRASGLVGPYRRPLAELGRVVLDEVAGGDSTRNDGVST